MSGMKDQLGDQPYPLTPGWRDPETSRAAAEQVKESAETVRARVLVHLQANGPSTVHKTAKALGMSVPTVQPRFSELKAANKIRWTGGNERNEVSRASAKVWEAIT